MNSLSLRIKLILPIFFLMAVIFFIAHWFSYHKDVSQNEKRLVERVQVLSKGVSYNLHAAILFDDPITAQEILSAFEADEDVVRVKLYDKHAKLFAFYSKQGFDVAVPNELSVSRLVDNGYTMTEHYMYMHVPIELEGDQIASLRVTISTRSFEKIYKAALKNSAYFITILSLCGFVLYFLVQQLIVNPVYLLNDAMKYFIENRQRKPELLHKSQDEIGQLVMAFNTMLEQIESHESHLGLTLDRLESEKAFANEVLDTVQHALLVVDQQGTVILSNHAASRVFNRNLDELYGAKIQHILDTVGTSLIVQALSMELELDDELFVVKGSDKYVPEQLLKISTRPLSRPDQILFAVEDVTEVEMALSRQRLAAGVFENSKDGLVLLNNHGTITMTNPAVTQLLGYTCDSLLDKQIDEVPFWPQFTSLLPAIKQSLYEFGQWQGEIWEQHKEGQLVPLFARVNTVPIPDFPTQYDMVVMFSDLSDVKEMEKLEYMAHHDALTGLANRSKFYRVLKEVIVENRKNGSPFSLLYLDLDGFKSVNDTYGHDAGDEVLKQVSQRLLAQVRNQDLVARLSGDEFVVVVAPSEHSSVRILSERLIKLIEQDIIYKEFRLKVGVSIGVYFVEYCREDIDSMMKAADSAMYKAKSLGKGQFVIIDSNAEGND